VIKRLLAWIFGFTQEKWPGFESVYMGKTVQERLNFWIRIRTWLGHEQTRAFFIMAEERYQKLQGQLLDTPHGPQLPDQLLELRGKLQQAEQLMSFPSYVETQVKNLERLLKDTSGPDGQA
jgi:hypothetical protein